MVRTTVTIALLLFASCLGLMCDEAMDMPMMDGDAPMELPDASNDNSEMPDETPPPPPSGACCLIDTTCFDTLAAECNTLGGSFNVNESCDSFSCPGPSPEEVRQLAHELEAVIRADFDFYLRVVSIVGRDYWDLNGDEPAWTNELLGRGGATLDPNGFLTTKSFAARYRTIRHAAMLMRAAENADPALTDEQVRSTAGFAKTLQAYSLLLVLNCQFSNGIIPETAIDESNPGDHFLSYTDGLQHIADLLDESATLLTNGGTSFIFDLSHGFAGFDRPSTFRQVNRALSARVRIYQGDKAGSISGIAGSFFNINGSMQTGPAHSYSIETRNPLYNRPDVDLFTVHPAYIADANAGDLRVSKKTRAYVPTMDFFVPISFEGLVGGFQVNTTTSSTASIPIIRNEELILIYAEAQIGSDVNESLAAINRVRNSAGLGNYLGATDDASMLNEVIKQRRYSFFGEGHRWVDLRRTGKIGQIPADRVGDVVHMEFPRPGSATINGI